MSQYKLITEMLALSKSKYWAQARDEWDFVGMRKGDGKDSCICGKTHIHYLCKLQNMSNLNTVIVGNCCVKQFWGFRADLIFAAVKRVNENITRSVNPPTLDLSVRLKWITPWEYNFYMSIRCKHYEKLFPKQVAKKHEINSKILRRIPIYKG